MKNEYSLLKHKLWIGLIAFVFIVVVTVMIYTSSHPIIISFGMDNNFLEAVKIQANYLQPKQGISVSPLCGTDSMGLVMKCSDTLRLSVIGQNEILTLGDIYIYNTTNSSNENHPIVHRYVACANDDCSKLVFKGDNNYYAEIINRSQVAYKVIGIDYESLQLNKG